MKFSLVIPAYNEEAILTATAKTLTEALDAMQKNGIFDAWELIFVSDGSRDATPALIEEASAHDPRIVPCIYSPNRGKGCAVRTGVLASSGDYVLYTDCDLAYGTDKIGEAVQKIKECGADFLIGSRAIHPEGYAGYNFLRKLASRIYLRVLAAFAGFRLSDSQCGFKCMKGDVGRAIFSKCRTDSFAFDFEVLMRAQRSGKTIAEFPVKIVNHRASTVHLVRDGLRMLGDIRDIKRQLKKEQK